MRGRASALAALGLVACNALVGLEAGNLDAGAGGAGGVASSAKSATVGGGGGGSGTCFDNLKNEGETDIDCGGPCLPCAFGHSCASTADCAGGTCDDEICVPPPEPLWVQDVPATQPSAREEYMMAEDATGGAILFGGQVSTGAGEQADTWRYDGTTWAQLMVTGPGARRNAAVAFDPVSSRTVLFGGRSAGNVLSDTWAWDGTQWSQVTTSQSPTAGNGAEMVYDPVHAVLVLFGGGQVVTGGAPLSDTWTFDVPTSTWTKQSPINHPSGRVRHAMSWDPISSRVLLFGGYEDLTFQNVSNETWVWDGSDWTQVAMMSTLSGRASAQVTTDGDRGVVVLYGGFDGTAQASDTWEWSGTTWGQVATTVNPGPLERAGMTFLPKFHRSVMFAGSNGSMPKTWLYYALDLPCHANTDCGSEACMDHLCCERVCDACETCDRIDSPGQCVTVKGCDAGTK